MNSHVSTELLKHVDPRRRDFLAKLIAGGVAIPAMTSLALAQPPGGLGKGKGGLSGKGNFQGKGKGGFAGKGNFQGKGGSSGQGMTSGDPAQTAAKLLQQFDRDGDKALNLQELTAALQSLGERRGMMNGKGKGGFAGKGSAGNGKGGFAGQGSPQSGSVKPKRPSDDS